MPSIITQIDIDLPPPLTTIEEISFWRYLTWQNDKSQLTRRIINQFRPSALSTAGYNDDNRPDKRTETPLEIGELEFLITTTPTTKTPSYSRMNEEFENYLSHLKELIGQRRLRKGYRTINGEVYIELELLVDKLENDKKELLSGKDGIEQKIALIKPEKLIAEVPEHMAIVLDGSYDKITEYTARMFVLAENMIAEGNRRTEGFTQEIDGEKTEVSRFKRLLLEDSLQRVGEYPTSPIAVGYPFEQFTFVHQLEPRSRTGYARIINAFTIQGPNRPTRRSNIGDFVKIKDMAQDEAIKARLIELGLVDDEFMSDYHPRTRGGRIFVRLQGVMDRLGLYRENATTPYIETNLTVKRAK